MSEEAWLDEHRGLVKQIAVQVANQYRLKRHLDDLMAWGMQGLLEARERFDASRGVRFSTYAWYRIRGRILDGCRLMGISAKRKATLVRDEAWTDHQKEELDNAEPANDTIEAIGTDLDAMISDAASIYFLTEDEMPEPLVDKAPSPEQQAMTNNSHEWVRKCVAELDTQSRQVVELSFFEGKTLDEIGQTLGLSRSWLSRVRSNALKQLRRALSGEHA